MLRFSRLRDQWLPTGDTRHDFDINDKVAVAQAKQRFEDLTSADFVAARRTGIGTSELVRGFDPTVQETLSLAGELYQASLNLTR
jgi:hypothetical protein